eukprot:gene5528-6213_t
MDNFCGKCNKICVGEVLFAHNEYFHKDCFKCKACTKNLLTSGFYSYENEIYCSNDYQRLFGINCRGCGKLVEGEVVTIMEDSFHQDCFSCARCRTLFPPGAKISFDGENYLCDNCIQDIENEMQQSPTIESTCAGCGSEIKSGQALLALDSQWHLWCFTCHKCGCLLSGEYMGRDGVPYCEKDYQDEFGVTCAGCSGYITGKVLQAGEKHYHPQCSRCAKCNQIFGEGEEMYLQGSEIWHPECSDAYQAEENMRNAYQNDVDVAVETQPLQMEPRPASPPPVEERKDDISRATSDFMQQPYDEPEREERAPPQPVRPVNPDNDDMTRITRKYIDRVSHPPDSNKQQPPETSSDQFRRPSPKPEETVPKRQSPIDTMATKAYSARPFETPKTTPASISLNFKPKTTLNTTGKWRPPEPKTAPPPNNEPVESSVKTTTTTTSLYRPSRSAPTNTEPERTSFKRPEPPKPKVKSEITTKYSVKAVSKEEPAVPVSNGVQKFSSISSDEDAPARPPPPPTRGSSQNWKSRVPPSADSYKRPTSPPSNQEAPKAQTSPNADMDVRSANRPISYLESAAKRNGTTYQTETKRTTVNIHAKYDADDNNLTNVTVKSVSQSSDDAPMPNALFRRTPAGANRDATRENRKSMPLMQDAVDNKPVMMRANGPERTESKAMNRRSLPSMDKLLDEQARSSYPVYPYSVLRSTNYKMPKEVDRSRLEAYLADDEFQQIFHMDKDGFYNMPAWKQRDMKKKVSLF